MDFPQRLDLCPFRTLEPIIRVTRNISSNSEVLISSHVGCTRS